MRIYGYGMDEIKWTKRKDENVTIHHDKDDLEI